MTKLTSKERMSRIMKRQPVDRIGVSESFWTETTKKWVEEGHIAKDEPFPDHFSLDIRECWALNMTAKPDFKEEILEETDETRLVRDGNGALLRWHKKHSSTPENVDYLVKDRNTWEEHIRPFLIKNDNYRQRIKFEEYRAMRKKCESQQVFLALTNFNVFELMHHVCGLEYMLMGMGLEPDWIRDMANVLAELSINLMETLFSEEGPPDVVFFAEDMGFKEKPFMSPAMYKEIIFPSHKRIFDFLHSRGIPVMVHSCGYVEPLIPGLIEAGMDCLQAMEVKAGMDLLRIKKAYGDRIALMGGIDIRSIATNNRSKITEEIQKKLPSAMAGGGYCLSTDHSIPPEVEYDTYKFFVEQGREMGRYNP